MKHELMTVEVKMDFNVFKVEKMTALTYWSILAIYSSHCLS